MQSTANAQRVNTFCFLLCCYCCDLPGPRCKQLHRMNYVQGGRNSSYVTPLSCFQLRLDDDRDRIFVICTYILYGQAQQTWMMDIEYKYIPINMNFKLVLSICSDLTRRLRVSLMNLSILLVHRGATCRVRLPVITSYVWSHANELSACINVTSVISRKR